MEEMRSVIHELSDNQSRVRSSERRKGLLSLRAELLRAGFCCLPLLPVLPLLPLEEREDDDEPMNLRESSAAAFNSA